MNNISVITVNFNQPEVTEQLIASIIKQCTLLPEIIVVDNGSRENPVPGWEEKYPFIHFIRSTVNLGFAGGNNLGIRKARGNYLFLVNNDTEFTAGLLEILSGTLDRHPHAGAVSPKIRFYAQPDMLQYAGYTPMNYYTMQNATIGLLEKDEGQYDHMEAPTAFAHGAAMMINTAAIAATGPMPENFFLYYEEMDWCEQFKRAGFGVMVNTNALIYHKESVSVGRKSALKEYFMNRNRILFARRNSGRAARYFFYCYFILAVTPRNILVYLKERTVSFIPVLLKAIWWNISHAKDSMETGYPLTNIK